MRFILLLIGICFALLSSAQDYLNQDSLWQVLKKSQPDTNRVKLYIQLGQQYEGNNPDSAIWLYEQAFELSQKLKYKRGIISYYTNVTYVYNLKGAYDTSLQLNLKSVEIAKELGDPERIAATIANVGASYIYLDHYESAIEQYLQIIPTIEKLKLVRHLNNTYDNLSTLYRKVNQYQKAKDYGRMAVASARALNNPYRLSGSLNNLAVALLSLGEITESIKILKEAEKLSRDSNNLFLLLTTTCNILDAHLKKHDFAPTKKYAKEIISLANQLDEPESHSIGLHGMAIYYFNHDKPELAESFALQSLHESSKHGLLEHIGKAYGVLAEIAILKKDFIKNSTFSMKSDSIRNVLINETITRNIQNVEARYESEKKEQQIKDLEQQTEIKDLSIQQNRLLIIILAAVLISVMVIAWLGRRTYRQKKLLLEKDNVLKQSRITELETEKQLLASEAVIKGQDEERGRLAKDLHDGLGGLLSGVKFSLTNMKSNVVLDGESALVFERSLDMLDHSISELRRVAHNMMPEVLVKFGLTEALKSYCDHLAESKIYKIDFQSIGMKGRLEKNTEIFIYRIIQELLNNISKHAQATQVLVQLAQQENELNVTVEDNGRGITNDEVTQSAGAGWANIRSRVEYLKGKLDVQSGSGQGTSVHITLPVL